MPVPVRGQRWGEQGVFLSGCVTHGAALGPGGRAPVRTDTEVQGPAPLATQLSWEFGN